MISARTTTENMVATYLNFFVEKGNIVLAFP